MTTIDFNTFERLRSQGISDSTIADQMALSNKTFAGYYNKLKKDTDSDPRATTAYLNYRFYGDANHSSPELEKQKGYFGRTADRMFERSKEITQSLDNYQTGKQGALNTTAQIGANLFRGAISPATEGISTIANKALSVTGLDDNLANITSDVVNSDFTQGIINSNQAKGVTNFMQNNPTGRTIGDLGMAGFEAADIVGAGYAGNIAKQGLQYGAKQGLQGTKAVVGAIRQPLDAIQGFRGTKAGVNALGETVTELTEVGKQAVKQGVDEKVVRFAGGLNPETKLLAQEMTKQAYKGSKELGGTTAHTEILGQQVVAPLEFSLKVKSEIGKRLGAMKRARYGEDVDVTEEFGLLRNRFDELGIQVGEKGKIVSTGALGNDAKPLMQQLYDFFGDSDGPVIKDFKDIDNFRSKMFDELGSAKGKVNIEQQQIFNRAEALINDMRGALFNRAANGDQALLGLNNLYGKISKPISTFMQRSGIAKLNSKLNVDDLNVADLKAGQFSRRTLGNAAADAKAELKEMIELAKELGYESNIDVDSLITYSRALEDLYKIQRPASLGGEIGSALGNGMVGGAAQDLIRGVGVGRTAVNAGTEAVMKLFNQIKGITPDQQTKLLLELFNTSENANLIQTVKRVLGENIAEKVDDLVPNSVTVGDILNKGDDLPKGATNMLDDLTPEERATGLTGGGGDNMPRKLPQHLQKLVDEQSAKYSVTDVTVDGYSPSNSKSVVQTLDKLSGESTEQAITRYVNNQIDNGTVKLVETNDGWKATMNIGDGGETFSAYSKQDVINKVFDEFYPNSKFATTTTDLATEAKFINPINNKEWDGNKIPYEWAEYTTAKKRKYLDALDIWNKANKK